MKTCRELAEAMLVSRSTIYRAMEDGRIEVLPIGRLKRISDVEYSRLLREGIPQVHSRAGDDG